MGLMSRKTPFVINKKKSHAAKLVYFNENHNLNFDKNKNPNSCDKPLNKKAKQKSS